MKKDIALNIFKNTENVLKQFYHKFDHPTEIERQELEALGFDISIFSYYDGRTLVAKNKEVSIEAYRYLGQQLISFVDKSVFPYDILIIEHYFDERFSHFNCDPFKGDQNFKVLKNIDDIEDNPIVGNQDIITPEINDFLKTIFQTVNAEKNTNGLVQLVRLVES